MWALFADGVAGYAYLHKLRVGDAEQLVRAIHEVASGGSVLDPAIVQRLLAHRAEKPGSPLSQLSEGELDVLRLMAEGYSNAGIGLADPAGDRDRGEAHRRSVHEAGADRARRRQPAGPGRAALSAASRHGAADVTDRRVPAARGTGTVAEPSPRCRRPVGCSRPACPPSAAIRSVMCCTPLPRARRARVESAAVVVHLEHDVAVALSEGDRGRGGRRVLAAVARATRRPRSRAPPRDRPTTGGGRRRCHLEGDGERQPTDVRPDRGGDAVVGEDARIDARGPDPAG